MSFTYAIGDIHGCLDKLRRLVAACERHAGERGARFVFLGDYIDRGADSAGVVGYIMAMQQRLAGGVVALRGNHEAMALDVVAGLAPEDYWLLQGGVHTLASYGVDDARDLPPGHLEWLGALPLTHDDGRRFFVHAGIDPDLPLAEQNEDDLLWIREPFLSDTRDYGRLIVHGHTPVEKGEADLRSNRLNLDTGAVFGGPLTAGVFTEQQSEPLAFLRAD